MKNHPKKTDGNDIELAGTRYCKSIIDVEHTAWNERQKGTLGIVGVFLGRWRPVWATDQGPWFAKKKKKKKKQYFLTDSHP
jgi:hypothetical protein